jgi:hypothetical protein
VFIPYRSMGVGPDTRCVPAPIRADSDVVVARALLCTDSFWFIVLTLCLLLSPHCIPLPRTVFPISHLTTLVSHSFLVY